VDLEHVAPFTGMTTLAGQFFSPAERCVLQALPSERTVDGFFAVWTRKEAVLKAVGAGLALPLDGFDVEADPDIPASLRSARLPALNGSWWLTDLEAGKGWRACLAIRSAAACVRAVLPEVALRREMP
jgi:4'-phosphopantetheinyl transferase